MGAGSSRRARIIGSAIGCYAIRSPLRVQTHPGEDPTQLPLPAALAPLYVHLLAGQTKAESGVLVNAQAWLAQSPAESRLRA